MKEVYKNKAALKEVNAAIQAKIYSDQSILLSDMIFPANGVLDNSKPFQKLKSALSITQGSFSISFWKYVEKKMIRNLTCF